MTYETVIGLEVHIQIDTRTKMFCGCSNCFGADANTSICPICMGYPGVLPVPNYLAIRRTILAGLMCNCEIARFSKFDRKSYFYPDMPKNYQITQFDLPLCGSGHLDLSGKTLSGDLIPEKTVKITRIHLEEDVGKSTHFATCSGIDYNRAGVPLMEIVSEPDMKTPDEAYVYLRTLRAVMKYAGISDCDMEKGQMRCDVNISVRPTGASYLNPKTELKNLNSFKMVHHAIEYEIERQSDVLNNNGELVQQTRGWNDDAGETYVLREKENAHDYRYFPEPDLMPIRISDAELAAIKEEMPETPTDKKVRFVEQYHLPDYDAGVLTSDMDIAAYFEICVDSGGSPKKVSNWIMSELLRELSRVDVPITACPVPPQNLVALLTLVENKTINGKIAKSVFDEMFSSGKTADAIVVEQGLRQVTDTSEIIGLVRLVIAENPAVVAQYREGKGTALNFLVGQVMKLSRGKANPQLAVSSLKTELD